MNEHKPLAISFKITRQDEERDFSSPDATGTIWTVHFKTPSGVESSVQLPDPDYSAEKVAELVGAKVQKIEQVHALTGAEALQGYR